MSSIDQMIKDGLKKQDGIYTYRTINSCTVLSSFSDNDLKILYRVMDALLKNLNSLDYGLCSLSKRLLHAQRLTEEERITFLVFMKRHRESKKIVSQFFWVVGEKQYRKKFLINHKKRIKDALRLNSNQNG